MARRFRVGRITFRAANAYVDARHRHNGSTVGHVFSLSCVEAGEVVGVAIVGRPVGRKSDDGTTAEVARMCSTGTEHVCSFLYGASCRAAFALGFDRVITFTRFDEPGISLRASGFRRVGETKAGSWDSPTRPRVDKTDTVPRVKWERTR